MIVSGTIGGNLTRLKNGHDKQVFNMVGPKWSL